MAQVLLEDVYKVYPGGIEAVKEANLAIQDQEFLVLVGPSGCGKSTTLRMIAGLEEITKGTIRIGDRVVNDVPPKDRDIAMVFQNYALYPHMTVYKNMAFGLKLRKYPRKEIDDRVKQAARILGITELLDRKPKALSGGQRQRVAVGRAIVRKPAAFLFDEPLSNLDAKLRVEMRRELKQLHHRLGSTMIYVTHDQIEAMTLGDRMAVMDVGLIQQVGEPLTIYDRPNNRFVAGFIGTPPMNFIEGELSQRNGATYFQGHGVTVRLPEELDANLRRDGSQASEVALGIRPEDIYVGGARPDLITEESTMDVEVAVVEPLGDEMILYLTAGPDDNKVDLLAKVDAHYRVKDQSRIQVEMNLRRAHVFDRETGENRTLANGMQAS